MQETLQVVAIPDAYSFYVRMGFPEKLDAAIEKSGKSQSAIARETGIAQSTISSMTRGERRPYADQAFKIARALGVTVDFLLDDGQDEPLSAAAGEPVSMDERYVVRTIRALNLTFDEAVRRLYLAAAGGVAEPGENVRPVETLHPVARRDLSELARREAAEAREAKEKQEKRRLGFELDPNGGIGGDPKLDPFPARRV